MEDETGLPAELLAISRQLIDLLADEAGFVLVKVATGTAEEWLALGVLERDEMGFYVYDDSEETT